MATGTVTPVAPATASQARGGGTQDGVARAVVGDLARQYVENPRFEALGHSRAGRGVPLAAPVGADAQPPREEEHHGPSDFARRHAGGSARYYVAVANRGSGQHLVAML